MAFSTMGGFKVPVSPVYPSFLSPISFDGPQSSFKTLVLLFLAPANSTTVEYLVHAACKDERTCIIYNLYVARCDVADSDTYTCLHENIESYTLPSPSFKV